MDNSSEKLQKFAKIMYIITKIGKIGMWIFVIIGAISIVWMIATGNSDGTIKTGEHFTVVVPDQTFWTKEADIPDTIPAINAYIAFSITNAAIMLGILIRLEAFFKRIKENYTPFTMENARTLTGIAVALFLYSILPNAVGSAVGTTLSNVYGIEGSYNYAPDQSLFFIALVFLCIAQVFRYGCQLQQQVDETL